MSTEQDETYAIEHVADLGANLQVYRVGINALREQDKNARVMPV